MILFQDKDWLVVDKPCGLATHAGKGAERPEPAREPEPALADAPDRGETMSRRRAMRAGRQDRG